MAITFFNSKIYGVKFLSLAGIVNFWPGSTFVGDYQSLSAPQTCEAGSDGTRVLRGGSWGATARNIRSADRDYLSTSFAHESIGFRVVQQ